MDKILAFLMIIVSFKSFGQTDEPIWDIGTKWTYEFNWQWESNDTFDFATVEIIDTVTINDLKLYVGERIHSTCNDRFYLHYKDEKVYNYQPPNNFLQLLYDFSSNNNYHTDYYQKCFANLQDSILKLPIIIDSTKTIILSNGESRNMKYVSVIDSFRDNNKIDTFKRIIIDGVGFVNGQGYSTHEWFIDEYYCDQFTCFPKHLRCFENGQTQINFVNFPCDSSFTSNIKEQQESPLKVYPNPTNNSIKIANLIKETNYEIFALSGRMIESGVINKDQEISINVPGIYLIKLGSKDKTKILKVVRVN